MAPAKPPQSQSSRTILEGRAPSRPGKLERHRGRLAGFRILARGLAERGGVGGGVEDVIDDLKRQSEVAAGGAQGREVGIRRAENKRDKSAPTPSPPIRGLGPTAHLRPQPSPHHNIPCPVLAHEVIRDYSTRCHRTDLLLTQGAARFRTTTGTA